MAHRSRKGGAAAAPPSPTLTDSPTAARSRRTRVLLASVAALGLAAASARLAWYLPVVQEWRIARTPLADLVKERGPVSDDPRLLYHIGRRLNQQERFADAEGNLRQAVGLDPDSAPLRDEWARALLGTGRVTEAFNQLRQFVGTHPDSGPGHRVLGKFYFTQKSMPRAREEFEKAVRLTPGDAEAWAYLSQAASQLSLPDVPLDAARKAVTLAPENAGYRLLLASLLEPANQAEAAGAEYARAAGLAPENAVTRQQYALWLSKHAADPAGRAKAEAEARRSLALDANDGNTHLLLGRLLRDAGRPAEAVAPLTEAAKLLPEDPSAPQALTQIHRARGNAPEADRWQDVWQKRQAYVTERHALFQELRVKPESRALRGKMARLLGTHGDVDGAVRNHAMSLRRPPDHVQTLVAAARDLTAGGYPDRALPLAERAVAQGKSSPEAHEALGDALLETGRMDEAIAHYNYTTNYQPKRAPAIQARVDRYAKAHPQPLTPAQKAYQEARRLMDGQIGLKRSPATALELMEKANALDPGNLTYLHLLLDLQFGARKTEDAIATAKQIAHIAPQDGRTQALLAVLLVEKAATPAQFAEVQAYLDAAKNTPEAAAQRRYGAGLLALRQRDGKRAVSELTEAAKLDAAADITFYKLALAQKMSGDADAAAKAMAEYERRQKLKHEEFGLQGDVSQNPDSPAPYRKLVEFYKRNGRGAEADALRDVVRHRFGAGTPAKGGSPDRSRTGAR
jgi:tetratricopeptide (TPR) repeat protein